MTSTSQDAQGQSSSSHISTGSTVHSASNVHRMFIGPMPEKVISQRETQGKKNKLTIGSVLSLISETDNGRIPPTSNKSEEVARVVKEHAFQFFIHHGGKAEEWDDQDEQSLMNEFARRWQESEWGKIWDRRHQRRKHESQNAGSAGHWVGTSFEVGNLLGMNIIHAQEHLTNKNVSQSEEPQLTGIIFNNSDIMLPLRPPSEQDLFSTPRSSFSPATNEPMDIDSANTESSSSPQKQGTPSPTTSITGLLRQRNDLGGAAQTPSTNGKGKAKTVHYTASTDQISILSNPDAPNTMLKRAKSIVDVNTTAIFSNNPSQRNLAGEFIWGDVVLRDRMLVRVSYTKSESLPQFNDAVNRTTRDLHYEDWGEFLVAWRRDTIEIYRDHGTPGKEWATGHKRLAYVIPLRSSKTRLSLYAFVDLTFCITCAPTTTRLNANASRWIFSRDKEGTKIFVFKLKSKSRAYDWYWQLWREMGGQIPRTVDIHNPGLNTKVSIDVHENEQMNSAALYKIFRRENILNLCMESLRDVPQWKNIVERELEKGKSLQLAWRLNTNLDWIWLETDVSDKPREWAVLCGLAFKQAPKPPVLEIRLADHIPNPTHLKDGRILVEPPAIEGYLDRIRPNTLSRQQTYLSIHNGNLFTLNTLSAFPPMPPGLGLSDMYSDAQSLRHAEIRRGTNQIVTATGMCDLRSVIAVRRASHPTPPHMHEERESPNEDDWEVSEERNTADEEDGGGDAGLIKHADRSRLRVRRSFELLLNTGHVIRFEAHSCKVALEWIERLRALIIYWKSRHHNDAKQEIELAQAQHPRLTPQTRIFQDNECPPEAPADPSAAYPAMNSLYNWCVLEGCRPIIKGGRIYMKSGLHKQYKLVQLFLIAGHLVPFRIVPHSSFNPAFRKKINLLDAYVYSGYFAAQTLPKGQYTPNTTPPPRRYQDGLETEDREEDMLFMIWYRPQQQMSSTDEDPTTTSLDQKSVPTLSAKNKTLVFKTRSVLERDSWCWALNSEIEKIVRAQKNREEKLRDTGNLVKLR